MKKLTLFIFLVGTCHLSAVPKPEKKFVIIITSYNNREWYKENLSSVFMQEYSNYRVIFVDDCSPDGTAELVEKYIKEMGQEHRVLLIKNKQRVRALANLYNAVHLCDDDDIVFNVDGDDWFAHPQVFSMINEIYQDPSIWITYGQFQNWPTGEMGYCKPVPDEWVQKKMFRKKWWKPGQLRTFYAWLFKQLPLKDLLFQGPYYNGLFFPANSDLAAYYPMMEMADTRFRFIPDVIYIRNVKTPINDFKANKEVQIMGSKQLREKPVYPTLASSVSGCFDWCKSSYPQIIVLSHDVIRTRRLLESCQQLVLHAGGIWVIYNEESHQDYAVLSHELKVKCVPFSRDHSLAERLSDCIMIESPSHILFLHDGMVFTRCVDLRTCLEMLEKTYAYGFYLGLHEQSLYGMHDGKSQALPALNRLNFGIDAWLFDQADDGDFKKAHTFCAGLYRTATARLLINALSECTEDVEECLQKMPVPEQSMGLCYHDACMTLIR